MRNIQWRARPCNLILACYCRERRTRDAGGGDRPHPVVRAGGGEGGGGGPVLQLGAAHHVPTRGGELGTEVRIYSSVRDLLTTVL